MGPTNEVDLTAVDLHRKPGGAGGPADMQADVEALLAAPLPDGEEAVLLTQPHGFCAGVDRAITIVELRTSTISTKNRYS